MSDPFDKTLRDLLGDDPRGLDVGDLADKPFRDYSGDDWLKATPLIHESAELVKATANQLEAERIGIERNQP